jgi:hypothetical protein
MGNAMHLPRLVLGLLCAACLSLNLAAAADAPTKPNLLTPEEIADGWLLLFDGQTLFGWKPASKANWAVADGAITASEGQPGLLLTTSQFGNYVLKADFRAAKGTNSGVFLRTSPRPTLEDLNTRCYELNIGGSEITKYPTGSLVQRQRVEGDPTRADWQTFEVTADRGHFAVTLDGKQVLDYTDRKPLGRGFIGLQFNTGRIEFRNIKLKPLGMASLFNGKDLAGWKTYPEMKSRFTVTPEGWINVKDGRGQLESEGQYADFTMQLDVYANGRGLNSGVFFRCIPGETMNGYECQIQNAIVDGDRAKPKDCGTGGIFRRQNARKVVSNDFEWFTLTLHADGPHVATWVNGYPVADWTDTRPADKNPRKGLRREAGTIMLQGHDPTTDLSFRRLRIAELPGR